MELIFALIAIIIALISIPWLKVPTESFFRQLRTKWVIFKLRQSYPSGLAIVKTLKNGSYSETKDDFMICDWKHDVNVDRLGYTNNVIDCTLVNISSEAREQYSFPIYFLDPPKNLNMWAKIGGESYSVEPEWDSKLGCGLIRIPFPKKLYPRDDIRFIFGHAPVWVYEVGGNWWEWYITRPHSIFRLKINFAPEWEVIGLTAVILPSGSKPKQPRLHRHNIYWHIKAPMVGHKYRLEFSLEHKEGGEELRLLQMRRGT
jgi:hypothetical protein